KQTAMIVEDDQLGSSNITYDELAAKTNQFSEIIKNLKLEKQSRVLVRLPNCLHYPIAFLGAMKAGCIAVPTSTLLTATEVIYLAKDSEAAVLVTDHETWKSLEPIAEELTFLKAVFIHQASHDLSSDYLDVKDLGIEIDKIEVCTPNPATKSDDPAYLVYTSGTTGYPKGVLHAHRALLGRNPASKYWFNFSAVHDRILHTGKFNWTYVLGSGLMDPLYLGKTVIVYEGKNNPNQWVDLIHKHNATIFIAVPTIYRQILQKTQSTKEDVPSLLHCMSAGEHLSDEVFERWNSRFRLDIYEAVGMSEFSYYISQSVHRPIRPGSAGFPQPGHKIKLINPETLEEIKAGEEGMICVPENDPGLFLEYWHLPEETAKYKHNGWFFTGDYARYDSDGYLWFLGRKDDIIKSFGYRVSPYEIERVFKAHPQVNDCAVIGEVSGDKVLVVVYVLASESSINPDDLVEYGRANLASYKAPKVVYITNHFPRTKNGKILRKDINRSTATAFSTIR
ncbi:MAG: acyl--CoA ligase, partial [Nitrosomonadales bacterium]|nr:acyl--CoA ligase [Nitrosomonadales bacterium]